MQLSQPIQAEESPNRSFEDVRHMTFGILRSSLDIPPSPRDRFKRTAQESAKAWR